MRPTPPAAAWIRIVSPGLHLVRAADQVPRGHALQHHRRALLVGDAVGQFHQSVGRHDARLAIGAERSAGIGDAVARLQVGDAGPDLLDNACSLGAEPARQRHRVEAAALVGVDVVEPDRRVTQADLALAGFADFDLLPLQDLGPAGLRETDRLHHVPPPSVWWRDDSEEPRRGKAGGRSRQPACYPSAASAVPRLYTGSGRSPRLARIASRSAPVAAVSRAGGSPVRTTP